MNSWRDELVEVIKSKAEREAEEQERRRKRIAEALEVAERALGEAIAGLEHAKTQFSEKGQPVGLDEQEGRRRLSLHDVVVSVELDRETAIVKVQYGEGKPREFDFATDRHLAPKDVEEYVGRRIVELARKAQKEHPW